MIATPHPACVLTLIAAPGGLDDGRVGRARAALGDAGARPEAEDWLAPDEACDLPFAGLAPAGAERAVRAALGPAPVDVIAQPRANRRKKLLVADMDSTIIEVECIDELADYMGIREAVEEITRATMAGELAFDESLRARAALLKGLKARALGRAFNDRVLYTRGVHRLVRTMRAHGAFTAIISGGFSYFSNRVRLSLGFSADRGNELEIVDGEITGKVLPPILGPNAKLEALMGYVDEHDLRSADVLAIGDGANDVAMLQTAGLGVAFHANPAAIAAADARIVHTDLTAVLSLQGYRAEEIVE